MEFELKTLTIGGISTPSQENSTGNFKRGSEAVGLVAVEVDDELDGEGQFLEGKNQSHR